jgi:hypothetical protein
MNAASSWWWRGVFCFSLVTACLAVLFDFDAVLVDSEARPLPLLAGSWWRRSASPSARTWFPITNIM